MLCLLLTQVNAQVHSVPLPPSLRQKLLHKYAPLDKSQVPGGYLLNQVVPFVSPQPYMGAVQDTALCGAEK